MTTTVKIFGLIFILGLGWPLLPAWAAGPMYWDWPTGRSFEEIELDGAAIDIDGNLTAGLHGQGTGLSGADVFWQAVSDGQGGYYTGTGNAGDIFHTDKAGNNRLVAQVDGSEVFALHVQADGNLLAGCGPEGKLFSVTPDGAVSELGEVGGGYIWAIAPAANQGEVWVAAGSPAAVYHYSPDDGLVEVASLPALNALDVMPDDHGGLWVATQGPGFVFHLAGKDDTSPRLLVETPQEEVRQFVRGPQNGLFVLALNSAADQEMGRSTNAGGDVSSGLLPLFGMDQQQAVPRAALYQLNDEGLVDPVWSGDLDLMICAWSSELGWLGGGPLAGGGSQSVLYNLVAPAGQHAIGGWTGGDIIDLLVQPDGSIVVCQAHPGTITLMRSQGQGKRRAISPPLDCGRPVQWGRLNWAGTKGSGKMRWSVRGGNRSQPDASWSAWSKAWSEQDHALDLPPSRFLQWRVEFPDSDDLSDRWSVTEVSVSAWRDNLPPEIHRFTLERIRDIKLGGLLSHSPNVTQVFHSGLKAEFSRPTRFEDKATGDRAAVSKPVRTFTWQGRDPEGDDLLYSLEYRHDGQSAWRPILTESSESLGSWDTSELPDGAYYVRLTVHDGADNPGDLALSSHRQLGPVQVDNTPPKISDFKVKKTDTGMRVSFTAKDDAKSLAVAVIQLPDGSRQRLDPVDRICDSRREDFHHDVTWPPAGVVSTEHPWHIRVEVRDLGGNLASAEGDVR